MNCDKTRKNFVHLENSSVNFVSRIKPELERRLSEEKVNKNQFRANLRQASMICIISLFDMQRNPPAATCGRLLRISTS